MTAGEYHDQGFNCCESVLQGLGDYLGGKERFNPLYCYWFWRRNWTHWRSVWGNNRSSDGSGNKIRETRPPGQRATRLALPESGEFLARCRTRVGELELPGSHRFNFEH